MNNGQIFACENGCEGATVANYVWRRLQHNGRFTCSKCQKQYFKLPNGRVVTEEQPRKEKA